MIGIENGMPVGKIHPASVARTDFLIESENPYGKDASDQSPCKR